RASASRLSATCSLLGARHQYTNRARHRASLPLAYLTPPESALFLDRSHESCAYHALSVELTFFRVGPEARVGMSPHGRSRVDVASRSLRSPVSEQDASWTARGITWFSTRSKRPATRPAPCRRWPSSLTAWRLVVSWPPGNQTLSSFCTP